MGPPLTLPALKGIGMSMRFLHSVRAGVVASAVAAVLVVPSVLNAQSVVNPTGAEFMPSTDHNATASDGTPVVTRYDLAFYLVGAAQPFQVTALGKPAPPDGTPLRRIWLSARTVQTAPVLSVMVVPRVPPPMSVM